MSGVFLSGSPSIEDDDGMKDMTMRITLNGQRFYAMVPKPNDFALDYSKELTNALNTMGRSIFRYIMQQRDENFKGAKK